MVTTYKISARRYLVASLTALALLLSCTSAAATATASAAATATETASASATISSNSGSGVVFTATNLQGNHTIFLAQGPTCSDGRATSYGRKPGGSLSLKVQLGWSGVICIKDIHSNTSTISLDSSRGGTLRASSITSNYHANVTIGKDLPLDVRLVVACDNDLSNMKPGSDCPSYTCSSQDPSNSWSCNVDDGHVIIGLFASLIPSRGAKGDGIVFSGSSRTKLNTFLVVCCSVAAIIIHRTYEFLLG